jgi:phage terminase large subunit GpA-like protein
MRCVTAALTEDLGYVGEAALSVAPRVFVPQPKLTLSEWADKHRILSRGAAAEAGRWRTARAPYQRGIMDAISDPAVERVVFMKSAQVGATELMLNAVGFHMAWDPCPILIVQPNLEMARAWSVDRLSPMLRESSILRGRVVESGRRHAENTILHKTFWGGHLTIVGANSAAGLASRPIRVVLFDEVDRYPESAGDEGDPINLGIARTRTYAWSRKLVMASTPTLKGMSRIEAAWEESDQRFYLVPCPHCEHRQRFVWGNLKYGDGDPTYACEGCGVLIEERYKPAMVAQGQWVATHPERKVVGFHVSALYSPWASWPELVSEWKSAQGNPLLLQSFVNLVLGESFEESGGFNAAALERRKVSTTHEVPAEVGVLTAGVDVQVDRLECTVWGWKAGEAAHRVGHWKMYGDPSATAVWKELDALLLRQFTHEGGGTMTIAATCVDSGFNTQRVYEFVQPRQGRRVFAVKGSSTAGAPLLPKKPSRVNRHGVAVFTLGVDAAKDLWYGRMKLALPGPGYVTFDMTTDQDYLEQLTSERRVRSLHAGKWASRYECLPNRRNEALDCAVYALAALYLMGPTRARLDTRKVGYTEGVSRETPVAVEPEESPAADPFRQTRKTLRTTVPWAKRF